MIKIEDFTKEEIVAALKARFPFSLDDMLYYCIQKKYDIESKKLDKKIKLNLQKQKQLLGLENISKYVKLSNETDRLMEKEEQLIKWYDKAMKEINEQKKGL
ncbi:MAG: hypothetical protein IKI31_02655 [Treponema sp.]|nr:hypothetical protein [Treponema sp.]